MFDQQEDAYEELGEEAEEDPVFVLTDEWRELFAKSEAKRREGIIISFAVQHLHVHS